MQFPKKLLRKPASQGFPTCESSAFLESFAEAISGKTVENGSSSPDCINLDIPQPELYLSFEDDSMLQLQYKADLNYQSDGQVFSFTLGKQKFLV